MTKQEFVDLVKVLFPGRGINHAVHSMTIEKLASLVYADVIKQYGSANPNALSNFRRPYTVSVTNSSATIPVGYISLPQNGSGILVKAPDNTLMYVPIGEEESILLKEIDTDELDSVVGYHASGNKLYFHNIPDSVSEVTISLIPTLDTLSDDDELVLPVGTDTTHLAQVMQFLVDSPEKHTNDRNKNTL